MPESGTIQCIKSSYKLIQAIKIKYKQRHVFSIFECVCVWYVAWKWWRLWQWFDYRCCCCCCSCCCCSKICWSFRCISVIAVRYSIPMLRFNMLFSFCNCRTWSCNIGTNSMEFIVAVAGPWSTSSTSSSWLLPLFNDPADLVDISIKSCDTVSCDAIVSVILPVVASRFVDAFFAVFLSLLFWYGAMFLCPLTKFLVDGNFISSSMSSYKRSASSLSSFGTVGIFECTFVCCNSSSETPPYGSCPRQPRTSAAWLIDYPIYKAVPLQRGHSLAHSRSSGRPSSKPHHNLSSRLLSHFTMAKNPCYALLWLILLVFIAWPVAGFASGLWIFLQPFEACFSFISDANSCLETYTTWPRKCGAAIQSCTSSCPTP